MQVQLDKLYSTTSGQNVRPLAHQDAAHVVALGVGGDFDRQALLVEITELVGIILEGETCR